MASVSLYFGKIPTELDAEQIHDYLFLLQKKSKTPSQTYFKHCVNGLRFLLKSEGLPYDFLRLPLIKHEKKLPVVLSKEEVWAMLQNAKLLKHKILIGLLYGCGLRCMEARSVRLQDLDFDRQQLKVVQGNKQEEWMDARVSELLPVPYFYVVFTLPASINSLAMHQPKMVYATLFEATWETLQSFGKAKEMQMGMIAVLHTWGAAIEFAPASALYCAWWWGE